MAIRYKALTELYQETQRKVTAPAEWQQFLTSACRNYRLSFDEQLLVYAQRPDATAVLEIERWNKRFGRWVNRGANGIAVFDGEHSGKQQLKYYFDVSDTHEGRFSRPVPLWTVRPEYAPDIIEALENSFGELEQKDNLGAALLSAANNAVEDNIHDYLSELSHLTEGSFLEELDEYNVEVMYRRALQTSIGYMLVARCGLDPSEYFEDDDFRDVLNFNTPETLNALGVATGDISQMCLSEIARTTLALQRQPQKENRTFETAQENQYPVIEQETKQPERSNEYGRDHIQQAGRLQPAESSAPAGAGSGSWEIRITAPEVPEGEPQDHLHQSVDQRETEQSSGGDRADGTLPDGSGSGADGQDRGRDGGTENPRSDEVGAAHEQPSERGGGNDPHGSDLQLTDTEQADSQELPAFLDEKQIMAVIANKDDDLKYKKQQIELFFSIHTDQQERADYLKSAYQDRYTEIIADGQRLGYKPQEDGLLMWEGSYLSRTKESVFSWDLVARWTAQLIDKKEYFIQTDIRQLPTQESQQMSLFDFPSFGSSIPSEGEPQIVQEPKKAYDLGFGHLGNGLTVWNRLEEVDGDYRTVAHIAPDRTVQIYDEEMPQEIRERIQQVADSSEMAVSATQNTPVFSVPPREEAPKKEQSAALSPALAAQVLRLMGEFDSSRMGYGEDDAQAVANIAQQLHNTAQRQEIRALLQSFLDHTDPEEEIAAEVALCMEQIGELPQPLTQDQALLEQAKELIDQFCQEEYDSYADFSDLENVGIAYTTVTDEEIPIQVNVDLVNYRVERYLDGQFLERRQYDSLESLIQNELTDLTFDDLISVSEEELESIGVSQDDYRLLSRLKADCDYYLGAGGRAEKHLWAGSVEAQITKMRELYDVLPEKPEWLTEQDIDNYESQMTGGPELLQPQKEEAAPLAPKRVRRERVTFAPLHPEIPREQRHDFHITDDALGHGTPGEKFAANVRAIRCLKRIEAEERLATPEEQEILSRYVG